ncbi:MAG: major capsid protein [Aerococcus sp.]|nr:major capsid protein [Aerococcus sp.]
MPLIHDIFTAANIADYYETINESTLPTIGEQLFPAKKQLGLKLSYVKGAGGAPVVLRASAFDTQVTFRDRMAVQMNEEDMPFFKEAMLVKETDRQQLNMVSQTQNQTLIDAITKNIFDDETNLLRGAHARLEAMRMQVLATGKIAVKSNGAAYDYDYGVDTTNKGKASVDWDKEGANPLADIEKGIDALTDKGYQPGVLVTNAKTFRLMQNASATIQRVANNKDATYVERDALEKFLRDKFDLIVKIENGTYQDDSGVSQKFYPDGYVTLAPNTTLGYTVFGTTPEESDLTSGNNLSVKIVDTGIAVTTENKTDPVNVQTKVSMIALPSFETINRVYMLDVLGHTKGVDEHHDDVAKPGVPTV